MQQSANLILSRAHRRMHLRILPKGQYHVAWRSDKHRDSNFGIEAGADDIGAATDYILKLREIPSVLLYGVSAGALKSALFTKRHPERVSRLALDAFVWTGKDSPTLAERRKTVPELMKHKRRPFTRAVIQSVFDRDLPGAAEPNMIEVFAQASMALDETVPTGTYLDMCTKLPMVDPSDIPVPTIMMRGQYDGIANINDLYEFLRDCPTRTNILPSCPASPMRASSKLIIFSYIILFTRSSVSRRLSLSVPRFDHHPKTTLKLPNQFGGT
jgi:pimeloyl-ACP methyl ester carboxylesterase